VAHIAKRCRVLGPGTRAVLWVQGCPIGCKGCLVPELQPFDGGIEAETEQLARIILSAEDIDGITLSGGEPFCQAGALVDLINKVRSVRDISVMSFTGYTLEQIMSAKDQAQMKLLKCLDILVDGPYVETLHSDLRWRGSSNQQVRFLTDRDIASARVSEERGYQIEFDVDPEGRFLWAGIPPHGFREQLAASLACSGVYLYETVEQVPQGKVEDE
jgi:anaerobic ribonucleoside-triphosphate reductase activating protein